MLRALEHRGPDGEGEAYLEARGPDDRLHGWFGHRRLKILDLSEHADQPMVGPASGTVLSYNGEIYNFRELRRELAAAGHTFSSSGDTEVLLRAYDQWGERCLERVHGMFAFAVWDPQLGRLLLARDRTGKKPLYYVHDRERFVFASEIKGLLATSWVARELDQEALPALFSHGYVPNPHTLYRDVRQVPPASALVFDGDGLRSPRRYWTPRPARLEGRPAATTLANVRSAFEGAVQRRLVADVPVGAFLSGGIDSSLVVGVASQAIDEPVRTFSIGFPEEPTFDERAYARQVAEHFQTTHTEFAVRADAVALLDRLVWQHDGPFGDSSAIPTFIISQLAAQDVTVVLNGDGGDEVFAGYDRFRAAAIASRVPQPVGRLLGRASRHVTPGSGYHDWRLRLLRFGADADRPVFERYRGWVAAAGDATVTDVLGRLGNAPSAERAHFAAAAGLPLLDRIVYVNFMTYLPDDLAVKMDRMSMAHSIEARSPFLDTAVIETAMRIPARRRIGLRHVKPVLRATFADLLPPAIFARPKHGFGAPLAAWFRTGLSELFVDEVLAADARSRELIDTAVLQKAWGEHQAGLRDHGGLFWTVLTLERWLRTLEAPFALEAPVVAAAA